MRLSFRSTINFSAFSRAKRSILIRFMPKYAVGASSRSQKAHTWRLEAYVEDVEVRDREEDEA